MKINSFSLVLHFFNIRNLIKLQKPQEVGWLRGNSPKKLIYKQKHTVQSNIAFFFADSFFSPILWMNWPCHKKCDRKSRLYTLYLITDHERSWFFSFVLRCIIFFFLWKLTLYSSWIRGLCSTKCSSKMLHNLLYFMY